MCVGQSSEHDDEVIINESRDARILNKENAELCCLKIETLNYLARSYNKEF